MKNIIYIASIVILFTACTKNFEKINTNKNAPTQVSENLLLPTVIFDLSNITINQSYVFNDIVAQYAGNYEYNDLDLYRWQSDDRFWTPMYQILQNISDIKKIANENNHTNYHAISLILEAYIFSIITDAYGPVPMTESNKTLEGYTTPKYDNQEDIYNAIFEKLEEANTTIISTQSVNGDILFNGDLTKWKKFANSLHLRLLLRISSKEDVSSRMNAIVDNPSKYPIFTSNSDNAIYMYSGSYPDISSVAAPGGGRAYDYYRPIPTIHFINTLNKNNDPRLQLWISPKEGTDDFTLGVLPGINIGDIGRPDAYSRRSAEFFTSATKINSIFMTYSELNFILSEAVEKNIVNSGNAKSYYEEAVKASFEQWGVIIPTDFLTTKVPYDANTERLYEQKWLALYHTGIESWLDWKRTQKPSFLKAGEATINNGKIPVRLKYPSLEQSVNEKNYKAASLSIGGDDINSSAWWW